MRKFKFLVAILFFVAAVISCEKEDDPVSQGLNDKKALGIVDSDFEPSTPVSDSGIIPYLIPGKNKGGNRTCEEVALAFNTSFDMCGEKRDYNENTMDFEGNFPEGLNVTVDGIYVSFEADDCIMIGDGYYKVGAVIVKGSNKANVYYYPDGTTADGHLAAPGDKFMVSNLTFCFIECEEESEDLIIAVKTRFWLSEASYLNGDKSTYTLSKGTMIFKGESGWCYNLGINEVYDGLSFYLDGDIGMVTVEEVYPAGIHSLQVTVDLEDTFVIDKTFIYVGDEDELTEGEGCPDYESFPFQDDTDQNVQVFTIPYSDFM